MNCTVRLPFQYDESEPEVYVEYEIHDTGPMADEIEIVSMLLHGKLVSSLPADVFDEVYDAVWEHAEKQGMMTTL